MVLYIQSSPRAIRWDGVNRTRLARGGRGQSDVSGTLADGPRQHSDNLVLHIPRPGVG